MQNNSGQAAARMSRKKWNSAHPFFTYIKRLIDNYAQSTGCITKMEGRLITNGRTKEFNKQFHNNMSQGMFRRLSKDERESYKGQ